MEPGFTGTTDDGVDFAAEAMGELVRFPLYALVHLRIADQ